jgi:hypothetical protein
VASAAEEDAGAPEPSLLHPAPYDALLQPWHHFDPSWVDRAELVVVGTLDQGSYPCIFHHDGSHEMPLRRTITVERVIQGQLLRSAFDLAGIFAPSLDFPLELHEGRRYLIFLSPGDEARRLLNDPEHIFNVDTQLQQRDLTAMVDLDQSEDEAAAHRRRAARWPELMAFRFTAEEWEQMRAAPTVDLEQVERFLHVIRETFLPSPERHVVMHRSLGSPDAQRREGDETVEEYQLNLAARSNPRPGMIAARIELRFDTRGQLISYGEHFDLSEDGRFREATPNELEPFGLVTHGVSWR